MSARTANKKAIGGLDSFARLANVMSKQGGKTPDMKTAFGRLAKKLGKGHRESGTFQVVIGGRGQRKAWTLELTSDGCQARQRATDAPRFEIVARAPAIKAMLSGEIAPIAAMANGDMRIRGDLEFGKMLYKLLAADNGRIDPCQ